MTTSASSLVLPTLTPKALSLYSPKSSLISFRTLACPLKLNTNLVCASASFLHFQREIPSRNVRKVAISSQFDQEEDVFSDGDEPRLSADLKLFVGNLPFTVDSAQLAGLFENAGNVEVVEVIYDKTTGRSRGFGFVTMSSVEEVEAAAQQFNGYELEGRSLRVNAGPPPPKGDGFSSRRDGFSSRGDGFSSRGDGFSSRRDGYSSRGDGYSSRGDGYSSRGEGYSSRGEGYSSRGARGGVGSESSNRVYVGNLSWGVDNVALQDLFSEQGNVVEAKVVFDRESGRSRGFGFVTYNTAEEVSNAIQSLNGVDLNGRSIRVTHAEARQRPSF